MTGKDGYSIVIACSRAGGHREMPSNGIISYIHEKPEILPDIKKKYFGSIASRGVATAKRGGGF
jgi:hypothetical protein